MGYLLRQIGAFFSRLWGIAMFWRISPLDEVRTGSTLAGGLMFLFMVFFLIGLVLVMLGFDLDQVDAWLEAQGGWLDLAGEILIRIVLGFFLLMSVLLIPAMLFDRKAPGTPGWGATIAIILGALLVAYFCAVNVFVPLD